MRASFSRPRVSSSLACCAVSPAICSSRLRCSPTSRTDFDLLRGDLFLAAGQSAVAADQLLVALVDLAEALVEAVFLLGEAAFQGLELAAPRPRGGFELGARLEELLLGRELALLQLGFAIPPRLFAHTGGFALGLGEALLADVANPRPAENQDGCRDDDRGNRDP